MKIFDRDAIRLLVSILFFIGFILFTLICGCSTLFIVTTNLWHQGGEFVNQPTGDILSTAEYLYNNPISTPARFTSMRMDFSQSMCVWVYPRLTMGEFFFSRWLLNGERVPIDRYNLDTELGIQCLPLQDALPGLHLIEIQLYDSPFYNTLSYQWAIKIEAPTPTPTAP